jgi:hypothetical protein
MRQVCHEKFCNRFLAAASFLPLPLMSMKFGLKISISLLTLGLSGLTSALLAQDTPPAPPPPPAPPAGAPADAPPPPDQPPPPRRGGRGRPPGYDLKMLTDQLKLTPDQQKTIGDLIKSSRSKMAAIRSDDSLSGDDKRSKSRDIGKDTHDQIRAALTEDQQKTFDAMPPPGRPPRRPDSN